MQVPEQWTSTEVLHAVYLYGVFLLRSPYQPYLVPDIGSCFAGAQLFLQNNPLNFICVYDFWENLHNFNYRTYPSSKCICICHHQSGNRDLRQHDNIYAYEYFSNLNESGREGFVGLLKRLRKLFKTKNQSDSEMRKFKRTREEVRKWLGNMWNLLLFSFRDIFLLSLRSPHSYGQAPSTVTSDSLRSSRVLVTRASVFLVEGVVGAVILDNYYPCGETFKMIRYFGWISVFTLIVSVQLIIIVSIYIKPKILATIMTERYLFLRNLIIFTVGTSFCVVISLRAQSESSEVLVVFIIHLSISVLFSALFYWLGRPSAGGSSKCCGVSGVYSKIKTCFKSCTSCFKCCRCSECCKSEKSNEENVDVETVAPLMQETANLWNYLNIVTCILYSCYV